MPILKQIDHIFTKLKLFFQTKKLFCIVILLLVLCGVYLRLMPIEGFQFGKKKSNDVSKDEFDQKITQLSGAIQKVYDDSKSNTEDIGKTVDAIKKVNDYRKSNTEDIKKTVDETNKVKKTADDAAGKVGKVDDKVNKMNTTVSAVQATAANAAKDASSVKGIADNAGRKASEAEGKAKNAELNAKNANEKSGETLEVAKKTQGDANTAKKKVNDWESWESVKEPFTSTFSKW